MVISMANIDISHAETHMCEVAVELYHTYVVLSGTNSLKSVRFFKRVYILNKKHLAYKKV